MSVIHVVSFATALVLSAGAMAQEAPAAPPAPTAAASMPHGCGMAIGGQSTEKAAPAPMPAGCPMAASTSPAKAKAKRGHDHARFHKLM